MRNGSSICRRRRCGPRYSMPARCRRVRSARCTGSSRPPRKSTSAATSFATRCTASPSCSRRAPTRCGAGTSPSFGAQSRGPPTTSTCCSTSFSRYVVGWLLARQESAALAKVLIGESCARQHIAPDQLIIHADRGPSMTSQPVALLLATLGVVPSHSRPQVSDDNPFSEAQFKTLKYRPDFPDRFGAYEDAESFCQRFFPWYNREHRHGALGLMTPHDIHDGLAAAQWQRRAAVLRAAYQAHPERFPRGVPVPPPLPTAAWINKPPAPPALAVPEGTGS